MTAQDIQQKWERIGTEAFRSAEETGDPVRLVSVFARFGKYEEVQLEVPRTALVEVRKDIKSAGGAFLACFA